MLDSFLHAVWRHTSCQSIVLNPSHKQSDKDLDCSLGSYQIAVVHPQSFLWHTLLWRFLPLKWLSNVLLSWHLLAPSTKRSILSPHWNRMTLAHIDKQFWYVSWMKISGVVASETLMSCKTRKYMPVRKESGLTHYVTGTNCEREIGIHGIIIRSAFF